MEKRKRGKCNRKRKQGLPITIAMAKDSLVSKEVRHCTLIKQTLNFRRGIFIEDLFVWVIGWFFFLGKD